MWFLYYKRIINQSKLERGGTFARLWKQSIANEQNKSLYNDI